METGRLSREVEFEFGEDGGAAATGQIRGVILRHLHHGEVDSAVKLLAKCPPELAEAILEEDAKVASVAVKQAVAEMFLKAKDFGRGARAAVMVGDPAKAALLFEQAGQLAVAADLYEKGGKPEEAAELYLRDLKYDHAARVFDACGKTDRAAESLEKGARFYEAAQLWTKARRLDKAVEALQKIDGRHESYVRSVVLLGRILESAGHRDAAAQKYLELVKTRPLDVQSVEAFERLAEIYVAMKQVHFAQKLLSAVVQFDPSRERATKLLQALAASAGAASGGLSATMPMVGPPAGPPPAVQAAPPQPGAPSGFVALAPGTIGAPSNRASSPDLQQAAAAARASAPLSVGGFAPLVLPPMPGQPAPTQPMQPSPPLQMPQPAAPPQVARPPAQMPRDTLPQAAPVIAPQAAPAPVAAPPAPLSPDALALRDLPAFAELTHEELRGIAAAGERIALGPGEIVIEQETEAKFVYVVLSGTVRVARVASDGMFPLAEMSAGSLVGEVALIDEGLTSARVKTHTEVTCFRWPVLRLRAHLAAQPPAQLKILKVVARTLAGRLRETNRRLTS